MKGKVFSVRVENELMKQIQDCAKRDRVSESDVIRNALEWYFRRPQEVKAQRKFRLLLRELAVSRLLHEEVVKLTCTNQKEAKKRVAAITRQGKKTADEVYWKLETFQAKLPGFLPDAPDEMLPEDLEIPELLDTADDEIPWD